MPDRNYRPNTCKNDGKIAHEKNDGRRWGASKQNREDKRSDASTEIQDFAGGPQKKHRNPQLKTASREPENAEIP
jgi:hypothetical protein